MKRSGDAETHGRPQRVVYSESGEITIGNPCPVVDVETGTVRMLFCRNNVDVLVTHSSDNGLTWSNPVDITRDVKKNAWTWYATGPGVGIQLRNGVRKGRLLIPCDHRNPEAYDCGSHSVYSDDGGASWRLGGSVRPGANECQFGELADGTVVMNTRMQTHSEGYRGVAFSRDGGESWTGSHTTATCPAPNARPAWLKAQPKTACCFRIPRRPLCQTPAGERA